jgi:putative addiction module CopG family antidote
MRTTTQMSITLPNAMAERVRSKVAAGDYASESEVIRDGLRALEEKDEAFEHWLRTEVVAAMEEMEADPERARSLDSVKEELAARHARTKRQKAA